MKSRPQEPADSRYLYEQIYLELRKEILAGKYRKGDWFPPERVLKDRFGTTHLTVRNALAKLVLEGYIERYSGKGTVVIYSREVGAAPRKVLLFPWAHVILENLDEENAALLEKLEARLRRVPLAVRVSCHGGDVLLERGLRREAEAGGALVILSPARSTEPEAQEAPGAATILVGGSETRGAGPRVLVDDAGGARAAVGLMAERGHRRAALLASPARWPGLRRGFLDGLASLGLAADPRSVVTCAPGMQGGAQAARGLLSSVPGCRAFLCASDETAAGALTAVREAGLVPGKEAAVIGFGNTALARGLGLTSLDPGPGQLADRVLEVTLTAAREGGIPDQAFLVTPEVIVRET